MWKDARRIDNPYSGLYAQGTRFIGYKAYIIVYKSVLTYREFSNECSCVNLYYELKRV